MDTRPRKLGERLAELRRQNGWTLEKVSKMTGVGVSTLSKVENQLNGASFDTLLKLSKGLGMNFEELLNPERKNVVSGRRVVTRDGEGEKFATAQYGYEVHATDLAQKKMIPLVMTVRARSIEEFESFSSHAGEEYIYVIQGVVEMHTEIYAPLRLAVGDSIYFDSSTPHALISVGAGDAQMLSLCLGSERELEQIRSEAALLNVAG
jgi:transcriptional regulator with XRE-family HTH domain